MSNDNVVFNIHNHNDVVYKLDQLIGDVQTVPLVQVVGPYNCNKGEFIKNYLKNKNLLYSYINLSIYQHSSGGSNILLNYEWNKFKKKTIENTLKLLNIDNTDDTSSELKYELEDLENFNIDNGNNLAQFTQETFKFLNKYKFNNNKNTNSNKLVYLFNNYNSIINDTKLLINILKLHEHIYSSANTSNTGSLLNTTGISNPHEDDDNNKKNKNNKNKLLNLLVKNKLINKNKNNNQIVNYKLVVILIGLYEVPIKYQFNLPLPKVHVFPSKSVDDILNTINDKINGLEANDNTVRYIIQTLYKYYSNDIKSLTLYINLLLNNYINKSNTGAINELNKYLYNLMNNYKTRYISNIFNTPYQKSNYDQENGLYTIDDIDLLDMELNIESNPNNLYTNNSLILLKNLGDLCKIVLVSAYISANFLVKTNTQYYKRYVDPSRLSNKTTTNNTNNNGNDNKDGKKSSKNTKSNRRTNELKKVNKSPNKPKLNEETNKKGEFTLGYWLSITELVLIIKKLSFTDKSQIFKNMVWLIEEGYVYVLNNSNNLATGKSGLLFSKSNMTNRNSSNTTSKTSNSKELPYVSNLMLLNNNTKFCLNVSTECIKPLIMELDINVEMFNF